MGNTGAHCCTVTNSPAFANQIEATESGQRRWLDSYTRKLNKHRNEDLQISLCLLACVLHCIYTVHAQKKPVHLLSHAKTRLLEQGPTEDSIRPQSHVDKFCRAIVKENLLHCQNVICCSVKRRVLQHKTRAA